MTIQPADATVRRHSGELKPGRSAEVDGALTDLFTFFGRAGTSVQIDLDSSDFDTVLVVRSPSGEEWENDDRDGDADKNSRLTVLLPEDGEYTVRITSYEKGKGGAYTLSLDGLTELQEVPSWEKVQPLLTRLERLRDCQGLDRYGRPFNLRAGSGIGLLDPATQAQVAETLRLPDLRDLWSVYPTESDNGR